jgi:Na+/H+-dicarboxylate symporter
LLNIIPQSIADAFVHGNILQIILFSVLFGVSLAGVRERARPFIEMLDLMLLGMFGIVRMVMALAPIETLGAMAYTIGKYGLVSSMTLMLHVNATEAPLRRIATAQNTAGNTITCPDPALPRGRSSEVHTRNVRP